MDDKPSLDPIEVGRLLAGLFLSQKLAAVVGPYAVIFLAAMAGAGYALANTKLEGRASFFFFFLWRVLGALLATVPVATFVSLYNDKWEAQWFFIPVAAALAYYADRLRELAGTFFDGLKSWVRGWANKGNNAP